MEWLAEVIETTIEIFVTNKAEYLFFIGSTLISLLLLRKKRWILSKIIFLIGVTWVVFHRPMTDFLNTLGVDSFSEFRNYDIEEAKFWITTLDDVINPNFNIGLIIYYLILSLIFYIFLKYLARKNDFFHKYFTYIKFCIAIVFIGIAIKFTIYNSISLFLESSGRFIKLKRNFTNDLPIIHKDDKKINIVIYIGESTSIMNMGLYGYQRDTTPKLTGLKQVDPNLIVFNNVFSTHTHTTSSLLEAFSFAIEENDKYKIIEKRKRISIVDVLSKGGIESSLISNQGMTGSINQVSSIIFRNAKRVFSRESRHLGDNDTKIKKPRDDVFFLTQLENHFNDKMGNKDIIFLHSYAGHGDYLYNIPGIFRKKVDNLFVDKNIKSIVGRNVKLVDDIEGYDSAIRYIDFSVHESLKFVKHLQEPTIFLYFSDHGEAVYAGRGHDSSRFIHEMARVPFLLYFNDAARRDNSQLFDKYNTLSTMQNTATLAQLSSTILDLIGIEISEKSRSLIVETPVIGEKTYHPPIVLRETTEGTTYVNINKTSLGFTRRFNKNFIDKSDDATKIFTNTHSYDNGKNFNCYHRSNTFGKSFRGLLVSNCLEIDLVVAKNGELSVYHPPDENVGINLNNIFDLAYKKNIAMWIDAKNLQYNNNCKILFNFLNNKRDNVNPILIEFPSGSYTNNKELYDCADNFIKSGFYTSYYVPTKEATSCSNALIGGGDFESEPSCLVLKKDLKFAFDSGIYTDFSFDYLGIKALENIDFANKLRWNTWNVPPQVSDQKMPERFRMIISSNSDPNTI